MLDIKRNSKMHLSQHRDGLKNQTEAAVTRTLKLLDKSKGTVVAFRSPKDKTFQAWARKVKALAALMEAESSASDSSDVRAQVRPAAGACDDFVPPPSLFARPRTRGNSGGEIYIF